MAAAPAPQSPARRPRLLCEWKVTRDGTQGGHRPGPVPCALVTTEPKQGNLVLRQSGALACDLSESGRTPYTRTSVARSSVYLARIAGGARIR